MNLNIFNHIGELVSIAIKKLDIDIESFDLEHPHDFTNGDFSTNIAMVLAKKRGLNPKELAQKIVDLIQKDEMIEKVEVAGPGFINFYLSSTFFQNTIKEILENQENFGKNEIFKGKKVLVEHSSPNLFKPFHVGHVMNNAIGESIARIAEFSSAEVKKISYPSDVSLGIGKAVFAFLKRGISEINKFETEIEKLKFLGDCYVEGNLMYEESEDVQKQVRKITEMIYEKVEGIEYEAYNIGKKISLNYFLNITKRLGSNFDDFIFESEAGEIGEGIVRENLKDIFETSDGAIVYKGEQDGLHTRVFINNEGYPTYEAKDIGLLSIKFKRFDPDLSVVVTDNNQKSYYEVVLASAEKINKAWKEKTIHKTHGRMSFKGKKMSSRLGGVPTAVEILNEVASLVSERLEDKNDLQKIDDISIASLKFTILKTMAGRDIDFDPEVSLSFEGDSGPYLQYTVSRINSIIDKAESLNLKGGMPKEKDRFTTEVEKLLYRFEEVVLKSANDFSPHHITSYLLELSRAFNSWYGETKIIDPENVNTPYNLAIASCTAIVIKKGLYLLGINSPDRM